MTQHSRRQILKGSLALAALGALDVPAWALPALAQGDTIVPFTDIPDNVKWDSPPDRRLLDVRTIDGLITPADKFATLQHYGHPEVDPAAFHLKISGLVDRPVQLTVDNVKRLGSTELVASFECSGNRGPLNALCSSGRWTGVPLRTVLASAGVKAPAREFVFFGADHGDEDVEWRNEKFKIAVPFGRSLTREKALSPEPLLAWALNGAPLSKHQGAPLRLIVPGWYGVANVKWLSQIHVQADPFTGKYQTRWYRTIRGEMIDGETTFTETAVTHMQLKSFISRVAKNGADCTITGVALNDGTPLKSVDVRMDDGPWRAAAWDPATKEKYGWKLFSYVWRDAAPGDHAIVSRVTDITGKVQPTPEENATKKSFLEDNSQLTRQIKIA
jgi:DMSO/TMAO reductase YedYZ molybdopterin-dependent catalytic subunit